MTVHALKSPKVASLRSKVSPEEWQARVDLAAAYRLVDLYGMSDLIANHISVRVPGEHDAFLINAYGLLYEEITASSLLKIDHEGNILAKPDFGSLDYGVNRAGFVIHSAIHMGKPDVACVMHTHTWAGMAVSTMECGLLPNTQTSMRFAKISYHDYDGVVIDTDARAALVKSLGDNNAMILRNHGLLTTGATIPEAFNAMHRLELSCKTQIAAMSCNTKLVDVPTQVVEATYHELPAACPPPVRRARLAGAPAEARPDRSGLPRLIGYAAQLRTGVRRRRLRLLDRAGISFRRLAADGRHGGAGRRQCRDRALAQHLESRLLQRPGEARSGAAVRAAVDPGRHRRCRRASPSPSSSTSSAGCRSTGAAGSPASPSSAGCIRAASTSSACWPRKSTIPTAASPRTSASRPSSPSNSPRASCNASCSSSPS